MSKMAMLMELERLVDRFSGSEGMNATVLKEVMCLKMHKTGLITSVVYKPSVCVIVRGAKQVLLGEDVYHYAAGEFLSVAVEMPGVGQVTEAPEGKPYLAMAVELDVRLLGELLAQIESGVAREAGGGHKAMFVGKANDSLLDVMLRLARLLETPRDIPVMGPLLLRELHYRLLMSEYGAQIMQSALNGSAMQRIAEVIAVLQKDFTMGLRMEDLAEVARMSMSSFHHHFKQVTGMSPLQYQKQLRLTEARRLMVAEGASAAGAAYDVGYESSSQFSREYGRMFGAPPMADVARLRTV